jgi:hypothetical protein
MRYIRRPFTDTNAWQHTLPGELPLDGSEVGPLLRPLSRVQPPLREVLQGLDARELEGETVFDQLFGPQPEGDPRLARR